MPITLGVNIDHIATLRQARGVGYPDLVKAAKTAISSGADLIVVHLRGDRRHIQDNDLVMLKKHIKKPIHLEMAATKEMEHIALKVKPHSVCLVPESPEELTTQGGLKLTPKRIKDVAKMTKKLKAKGIGVSLFLDSEPRDIRTASFIGADIIELCTKTYAESTSKKQLLAELEKLQVASLLVRELELELHAGHGLDYANVLPIAKIENMQCLNIGFSIIAKAAFTGLEKAVKEMKQIIKSC